MKYWFSPGIEYTAFKKVYDRFPESGPYPENIDKILWELLRDRKLNIYIDSEKPDDPICFTTKKPPKQVMAITNSQRKAKP